MDYLVDHQHLCSKSEHNGQGRAGVEIESIGG